MTFAPEIVHISATPLVAAPAKIASVCSRLGALSLAIAHSDYPGALTGVFAAGYIFWKTASPEQRSAIESRLSKADIVHIHNDLPPDFAEIVLKASKNAAFIYHVHSPVREGPLYVPRDEDLGFPFAARLVVGQVWPRLWPGFRPVPNIVDAQPSLLRKGPNERLRVMYSPSHNRDGRWGGKRSKQLDDALSGLMSAGIIETVIPSSPLPPHALLELRRNVHVTIDEIITGGHHQVSLEGLCCGNAVVNGADFFSQAMLCTSARASEMPPFVHADPQSIGDTLVSLARDPDRLNALQNTSANFFRRWLLPERLGMIYLDIYKEVLNASN